MPEPEPRRLSWRIDIGPLPARWGRAGFALLCLVLAAVPIMFGLRSTRLECLRDLQQKPTCTLSESPPLPLVARFRPGSIARIDVQHESSGKGPGYWTVFILDQRGSQQRVASYGSREVAWALADSIRAYLSDGHRLRFSFTQAPNYVKLSLLAAITLLVVAVLLRNAFHQAGHLLLDIDRVHGELRVRRRLFGVPYGHLGRFALGELSDVQLEHGPVLDKLLTRGQLPMPGARLVLVHRSGHRYPLRPEYLPGPVLFQQGLQLLRAELGVQQEPREPERADTEPAVTEPADTETAFRDSPHQSAADARSRFRRFLSGAARYRPRAIPVVALGVTAIGVALYFANARNDGTLEIHAEYRCMFDGMEILPGGVMSTSLAPGRYEIHVFNSAAAGGWESQFYTLRAGQSLLVPCRPLRARH